MGGRDDAQSDQPRMNIDVPASAQFMELSQSSRRQPSQVNKESTLIGAPAEDPLCATNGGIHTSIVSPAHLSCLYVQFSLLQPWFSKG